MSLIIIIFQSIQGTILNQELLYFCMFFQEHDLIQFETKIFLERILCFTNTRTKLKFFGLPRRFSFRWCRQFYVMLVLVVRSHVASIRARTKRKVDAPENCLPAFQKCVSEEKESPKKCCGEKKGSRRLFWRACGGYAKQCSSQSKMANVIRLGLRRM